MQSGCGCVSPPFFLLHGVEDIATTCCFLTVFCHSNAVRRVVLPRSCVFIIPCSAISITMDSVALQGEEGTCIINDFGDRIDW